MAGEIGLAEETPRPPGMAGAAIVHHQSPLAPPPPKLPPPPPENPPPPPPPLRPPPQPPPHVGGTTMGGTHPPTTGGVPVALQEAARAEGLLEEDDRDHAEDPEEADQAEHRQPHAASGPGPLRRRLRLDPLEDAGDRRLEARRVASLAEARRDALADDLRGHHVGDRRLEPVADLDAHLALVTEHQEDQPVVEALLSDPPALGQADRIILEALALQRRKERDDHLHAGRLLALGQRRLETRALGGLQQARVVVDASGRGSRQDEGDGEDCREEQA